jgi:hypothetical protein
LNGRRVVKMLVGVGIVFLLTLFFGELTCGSFFLVHRLTATLALLLRLSPAYDTQLVPLLEVLQSREVLMRKLRKEGQGGVVWGKKEKEVRQLVEEVAGKLCR